MSEREPEKRKSMSEAGDPNPMEDAGREPVSTWEDPADQPGGSTSGSDVARPLDKEGARGGTGMVPGSTATGPSGSASGRSLYGMSPDEEKDADDS